MHYRNVITGKALSYVFQPIKRSIYSSHMGKLSYALQQFRSLRNLRNVYDVIGRLTQGHFDKCTSKGEDQINYGKKNGQHTAESIITHPKPVCGHADDINSKVRPMKRSGGSLIPPCHDITTAVYLMFTLVNSAVHKKTYCGIETSHLNSWSCV